MGGRSPAGTADARATLPAIPGIRAWTADYLLVRALQHPDVFVSGDLVACRTLGLDPQAATRRAENWSPYRSYAVLHLRTDGAYS